jgi:hypothetical protein
MKNRFFALSLILLLLSLMACTDSQLQKVSKGMLVFSQSLNVLQTDVIAANKSQLIDDKTTGTILEVCMKADAAGKQVDGILRTLSKIDPNSRSQIVNLITPIVNSLDPSQLEFIAGIKDPATKQKVDAAFTALRTTIAGVQMALAVGG